jgi:hypothetical protein
LFETLLKSRGWFVMKSGLSGWQDWVKKWSASKFLPFDSFSRCFPVVTFKAFNWYVKLEEGGMGRINHS